jgi:hypothetical protein
MLCLINRQKECLVFITLQVGNLFLDRLEHGRFATFIGNAEYCSDESLDDITTAEEGI